MSLKSRINHLSRGRVQILVINSLPDPLDLPAHHIGVLPRTPQREGESEQAWHNRLAELGRKLYPNKQVIEHSQLF